MSENSINIEEIRRAAENGDSLALYKLGLCCLSGDGVEQDEVKGIRCIKEAAEAGVPDARKWLKRHRKQRLKADESDGRKTGSGAFLYSPIYWWMWIIAAVIATIVLIKCKW